MFDSVNCLIFFSFRFFDPTLPRGGQCAVSSETATETFCGAVRCGFEAKTEMKSNRLIWFSAVSNSFGSVF